MQLCQVHFYEKNRTQKSRPRKYATLRTLAVSDFPKSEKYTMLEPVTTVVQPPTAESPKTIKIGFATHAST